MNALIFWLEAIVVSMTLVNTASVSARDLDFYEIVYFTVDLMINMGRGDFD